MQQDDNTYYLKGFMRGDSEVLLQLYDEILPKVKNWVVDEGGMSEDAEDVFHEALMQLYARMQRRPFIIHTTFKGYVFTACKNIWRREFNKKLKMRVTSEGYSERYVEEGPLNISALDVLEQEKWELFYEKFQELSENCRRILELNLKKKSAKEIMERLSYKSTNVVRQRIFKCKSALLNAIKGDRRYRE